MKINLKVNIVKIFYLEDLFDDNIDKKSEF